MTARVDPRTTARTGDTVKFALDAEKIHIFDKETQVTITNQSVMKAWYKSRNYRKKQMNIRGPGVRKRPVFSFFSQTIKFCFVKA